MSDLCLVATMLAKMQMAEAGAVDLPPQPDRLSPSPKATLGLKAAIHLDRSAPETSVPELSGPSIDPQDALCRSTIAHPVSPDASPQSSGFLSRGFAPSGMPPGTANGTPRRMTQDRTVVEIAYRWSGFASGPIPGSAPGQPIPRTTHDPGFSPKSAVAPSIAAPAAPTSARATPIAPSHRSAPPSPVLPVASQSVASQSVASEPVASEPVASQAAALGSETFPLTPFTAPIAATSARTTAVSPHSRSVAPPLLTSLRSTPDSPVPAPPTSSPPSPGSSSLATRSIALQSTPQRSAPAPAAVALRPQPSLSIPGFVLPPDSGQVMPRFAPSYQGPTSGPQLYQQRRASLQAGRLYTRLPSDSFRATWASASHQPNYEQWQLLLAAEARAVAVGQGSSRLSVMLGDSLSLWMPGESLPQDRLWLNQGISGDTTTGILQRIHLFQQTRPDTIYVMAGINDLLQGASDQTVVQNLTTIARRLRQDHPQADIVLQSILPTDNRVPNARIRRINQQIAQIAQQQDARYLDLHPYFTDDRGNLRRDFTTDGVHLTALGYGVWQSFWQQVPGVMAQGRSTRPVL